MGLKLTDYQFRALHSLARREGSFSLEEMPPRVSIEKLAGRGLARVSIEITPEGRKALEEYLA